MTRNQRRDVEEYVRDDNYARDGLTDENINLNDKYATNGESEFSRESTRPMDMDPRLENRQYDLRDFSGRGPKNYRRSETTIHEEVCEASLRSPEVDASEIEVLVNDGTVRLIGQVQDRRTKKLAESLTENLPGVVDVRNELKIKGLDIEREKKEHHGLIRNETGLN